MLNFNACGTPLNIMQSSKYFARIFFIMIGTISKGGTVKFVTFIFPPLAKGHPNVYVCVCIHVYVCMHNIFGGNCPGGKCPTQKRNGNCPGNCPTPVHADVSR